MATQNTLTALMHTIIARAHVHLRGTLLLPGLVNSDFGAEEAEFGDTISVKIPQDVAAYNVVPGLTQQVVQDGLTPVKVPIPLDQWKASSFHLTDKDQMEIDAKRDFLPLQTIEAVDALAEAINDNILSHYTGVYGFVGTPGQTPFQNVAVPSAVHEGVLAATSARKQLNVQKVPRRNRRFVMNPEAAGNALALDAFIHMERLGSEETRREGEIGRRYAFDFYEELSVPNHTAGTITTGAIAKAATAQGVGTKAVTCTTASATGAVALLEGDIVHFVGDSQTYVVTADVTEASPATDFVLNIEPGLQVALVGSEALTVEASHAVNMAFHQFAFAFVNRPLQDGLVGNANIQAVTDPLSGLTIRLEIKREHKQTRWEFDALWGSALVIPALAVRVAGE